MEQGVSRQIEKQRQVYSSGVLQDDARFGEFQYMCVRLEQPSQLLE
jgi:hypothetical protein